LRRAAICWHARLALRLQGDTRRTAIEFRKHLGWYTKGLRGGAELRQQLFTIESMSEIESIFSEYLYGSLRSAAA
jgi:tRNA-dihydrouridine synthase